jgi:dihydroorotase
MCHAPAIAYNIRKRGFIKKGFYADLALVDLTKKWTISGENLLYKCGWSPFEGLEMHSQIISTFVNGRRVYHQGQFDESTRGMPLVFDRS